MSVELKSKTKTEYFSHSFDLSENQQKKLVEAIKNNQPSNLRLTTKSFHNGKIALPLTKTEALNVLNNKSFLYTLNKAKIKMFRVEKEAGFFPLLIPILAGISALAGVAGATTGVVKTVLDKKSNDVKNDEEKRHNLELESIAKGEALYLNPWKSGMNLDVKEFVNNSPLSDTGKKTLRNFLKNLSSSFKIEKRGSALYLNPY